MSYDDTERNEDWIKTLRWDLPRMTIEELREFTGKTDAQLRALPAIEAAPPEIRLALGLPEVPEPLPPQPA